MATRPTSVRGKNTRLGKLKKVKEYIKKYEAKNSPGALDSIKRSKLEKNTPKLIRMEKGPKRIQNPKAPNTRMDKGPRKMPNPRQESTRMNKGPRKMTPLKRKTK
jgi:hypothetical protein